MRGKTTVAVLLIILLAALPAAAQKRPADSAPGARSDFPCNIQGSPGLCIPLDETWTVVPFDNGVADCYENDDGYTGVAVPLGFTFDLFGSPQTEVYINNNGNVSFGGPFYTYTPEGFPVADYPMVAPFWADVDTRSMEDGAGVVWMMQGPDYLAVTWDHVGYYSQHTDLQCTFQLIISNGSADAPPGEGNNVCFCYGDMNWTTGDASEGEGGFGGSPATVGVNKGDGVDFFNVGRFDHPGDDYAGPDGVSGVDWLDFQSVCFSVGGETNQCPIAVNFPPGNTYVINNGNPTMDITVGFIGPEGGQTVTTTVDDGGLANFDYESTPGNPSTVHMTFTPDDTQIGVHVIHFVAVDDFDPPCTTQVDLTIVVDESIPVERATWSGLKTLYR